MNDLFIYTLNNTMQNSLHLFFQSHQHILVDNPENKNTIIRLQINRQEDVYIKL